MKSGPRGAARVVPSGYRRGCGLIFHRRVANYDLAAQPGKPAHGLPRLMGIIEGPRVFC